MSEHAFGTGSPIHAAPVGVSQEVHVTGRRVLATLVDGLVMFLLFLPLNMIAGAAGAASQSESVIAGLGLLASLAAMAISVTYYIVMEGYWGQTVGKMLLGIKVVREGTNEAPGFGGATIRTLLRIVDGFLAYLVGFVVVLASGKRQRLGDMAAHTLVVRK